MGMNEAHVKLLIDSYKRWTGKELVTPSPGSSAVDAVFNAPLAILSHGIEADPVLNYGNRLTLQLWEMDWETLTGMPSRLTAEPMEREARDRFFDKVTSDGYVDNYTGIRISKNGRRFYILNATVWNLIDDSNQYCGQAACFLNYRYLDDES